MTNSISKRKDPTQSRRKYTKTYIRLSYPQNPGYTLSSIQASSSQLTKTYPQQPTRSNKREQTNTRSKRSQTQRSSVSRLSTLSNRKDTYEKKTHRNQLHILRISYRQSITSTSTTQTTPIDRKLYNQSINRRALYQEKFVYSKTGDDSRNINKL